MVKKRIIIKTNPLELDFSFGNCAIIAIACAFNMSYMAIKAIFFAKGIFEVEKGATFNECRKVINVMSKVSGKESKYIHNHTKNSYFELIILLPKNNYIFHFSEHLSNCLNGEICDSYFYNHPFKKKIINTWIPIGWWKIN